MDNINNMMDDDGYAGYEADPLDDNYQVKCGQILVSATQKFSFRCTCCDLEYENLKDFINHCVEIHSFTDFEVDTKSNVPGQKSIFDSKDDTNMLSITPATCGSLDETSFNSSSPIRNTSYENVNKNLNNETVSKNVNPIKPIIKLKPLETLQKQNSDLSEDELRPPRKRIYEQAECRFQCKYCDKSYPYSSSLSKHRKTFHNDIKKYQCTFCDARFTDEIYLIRHQRARHKFELKPYAEDPIIIIDDFTAEQKKSSDEISFPEKIESSHNNENSQITNNKNIKTGSVRDNINALKIKLYSSFEVENSTHPISELHNQNDDDNNSNRNNPQRPPKVIYKCTMCPKEQNMTFRSKKEWQAHENHAHLQPEKFRCQTCNVGFPSKKQFQDHEQEKHQDQRPFKCPICLFAFKERKHLMRHERVHTGEKPFKCPFCAEQFTRKDALKTHHLKEHPDNNFE